MVFTLLCVLATGSVVSFLSRDRLSGVIAQLSSYTSQSLYDSSTDAVPDQPFEAEPDNTVESEPDETFETVLDDPVVEAQLAVEELLARQSKTLDQAIARYTLKTRRPPPPNYDQWFEFAQERSCLIDEYDQIHRDFEPFYQLAKEYPRHFKAMIERSPVEIAIVEIRDGEVDIRGDPEFSAHLPDMTFLLNSRDEPRVAFNVHAQGALGEALRPQDQTPFELAPSATSEFFKHRSGCVIPGRDPGFATSINDDTACDAKSGFTTDLYPLISMTKISPCFSDILFPTEYYYDQSWWSGKFEYPDDIAWEDKKDQIYWRGMSNGGQINGSNFHSFPRFRLVDLGREHPDLMDVAITTFAETLCLGDCDRDAVIAEYNITGDGQAREDMYEYKYALDVDGTTFSGRYLGLLRSGSLVFKATVFEEYFNGWLRPYEHYIPVLEDLSDLVEKIEWANENPDEARRIQQRGMQVAQNVVTDDQNDCYFFAVLLEWARLQEYAWSPDVSSDD
ncbi:glycosyl transferase family 90-domain-containing protein [Mycena crocata]|nr:glycosyl transferase family 90-domain-containing protein [Mycena crocata]